MARFAKGSMEFELMREYYILMQEFWEPDESDEFWENYVKRTGELLRKYDYSLFVRALVLALSDELERKLKAKK